MTDPTAARSAVDVLAAVLCETFNLGHDHEHFTPRICPDGPEDARAILAALRADPNARLVAEAIAPSVKVHSRCMGLDYVHSDDDECRSLPQED